MNENLDPKLFGLPPRTVLVQRSKNKISLVINRKSRIIMKDAQNLLKKAKTIKNSCSKASISLETTAPVCGKSIKFLNDNGIDVISK